MGDALGQLADTGELFLKIDVEGHEFALADHIATALLDYRATAMVAVHPHLFGIAKAARIKGTGPLDRLARSVVKRTIGRVEALRQVRRFAQTFDNRVVVRDINAAPIDLRARSVRVLRGRNITDAGLLILSSP